MSRDATPRRICPRTARRPLLDLPSPLTAIPAVGIRLSRRRPRRRLSAARHYSLCGSPVPHFLSPRPKSGGLSKHHHPSPALDSLPSRTKKARREDPTEGPRRWNHVSVPPPLPHSGVGQKAGPCQVLLPAHGSLHPPARGRLACALLSPAAKGSLLCWPSRYRQQAPPGLLTQGAADPPTLVPGRHSPPVQSCLSSSQTAPDTQPDRPSFSRHSPPSLHRHGVGGFPS